MKNFHFLANCVDESVGPGATIAVPEAVNHKLEPGMQLFDDGLACTLNISGVEFVPS